MASRRAAKSSALVLAHLAGDHYRWGALKVASRWQEEKSPTIPTSWAEVKICALVALQFVTCAFNICFSCSRKESRGDPSSSGCFISVFSSTNPTPWPRVHSGGCCAGKRGLQQLLEVLWSWLRGFLKNASRVSGWVGMRVHLPCWPCFNQKKAWGLSHTELWLTISYFDCKVARLWH